MKKTPKVKPGSGAYHRHKKTKMDKNELKKLLRDNMTIELKTVKRREATGVMSTIRTYLVASIYFDGDVICQSENIIKSRTLSHFLNLWKDKKNGKDKKNDRTH